MTDAEPRFVKVLFYTHALVDGGGERLWACLATAFHKRGYQVLFAEDFRADDNRGNLDPEIRVVTLGGSHIASVWALAKVLDAERPDVALSAIGGSGLKLLLARLLARRANTRTILSFHGADEWRTGLLSFLSYAGLAVFSRMADAVIAVGGDLRTLLIERWKAAPHKVVTLSNPVFFPADAPVPDRVALMSRQKLVLAVGRLVPDKDYMTMLRAFALVQDQTARLLILGKGPEEARLREGITRLGLAKRVTLGGYCSAPWDAYRTARAFAISSHAEAFGNVVVEALAFGLPVVATAAPGPLAILDNGRHGRIAPIGDAPALARAIDAALVDDGCPTERRRRADAFSFDARLPAYEALVRGVLGRHGVANGDQIALSAEARE